MNPILIILLCGCFIVFALDALRSIASRRFNFNYARLAPLTFIIYMAAGFLGTRAANQTSGIIVAAAIGFFDATIGWKTSMVLKANTGKIDNNPSVSRWVMTATFVTLLAAICGLAGAAIFQAI